MNLTDEPRQPLPTHLSRRKRSLLVLVATEAADYEQVAALLDPMSCLNEGIDHRVNPLGPGRSSPNSFDVFFRITTSSSNCQIRFFASASSTLSGFVIPGLTHTELASGRGDWFTGPRERDRLPPELDREWS